METSKEISRHLPTLPPEARETSEHSNSVGQSKSNVDFISYFLNNYQTPQIFCVQKEIGRDLEIEHRWALEKFMVELGRKVGHVKHSIPAGNKNGIDFYLQESSPKYLHSLMKKLGSQKRKIPNEKDYEISLKFQRGRFFIRVEYFHE